MITEDYCSYEVAKLLKEKGFDESCDKYYPLKGGEVEELTLYELNYHRSQFIKASTHQMAMKWLREVHGLFISISNDDLDYNWQIFDIKNRTKDLDPICLTGSYAGHRKYEQAVETALKYALENLI